MACTEEKFYPLSISDEFLKSPYEQYPVTNGHVNIDTEDSIKQRLITALFQFRFDEQEV